SGGQQGIFEHTEDADLAGIDDVVTGVFHVVVQRGIAGALYQVQHIVANIGLGEEVVQVRHHGAKIRQITVGQASASVGSQFVGVSNGRSIEGEVVGLCVPQTFHQRRLKQTIDLDLIIGRVEASDDVPTTGVDTGQ